MRILEDTNVIIDAFASSQAPIRIFISNQVHVEIMPSCPTIMIVSR